MLSFFFHFRVRRFHSLLGRLLLAVEVLLEVVRLAVEALLAVEAAEVLLVEARLDPRLQVRSFQFDQESTGERVENQLS